MRQLLKIKETCLKLLRVKNYKKVIHFGFLFLVLVLLWRVLPCGFLLLLVLLLCAGPQLSGLLDECLFALTEFVRFHLIDHAEVLQVIHNLIHRDRLNAKQNRTSAYLTTWFHRSKIYLNIYIYIVCVCVCGWRTLLMSS